MKEKIAIVESKKYKEEIGLLKLICGEEDWDLLVDMIDGETDVDKFVGKMIEIIQYDESNVEGLKIYQRKLADRRKRIEERVKRIRTLLASVVTEMPGRVYRHSLAHVGVFDVDPKIIITDESSIPVAYWIPQDPKLNETALRKYLLERQRQMELATKSNDKNEISARLREINRDFPFIEGVTLGNGEISVRIRGA